MTPLDYRCPTRRAARAKCVQGLAGENEGDHNQRNCKAGIFAFLSKILIKYVIKIALVPHWASLYH